MDASCHVLLVLPTTWVWPKDDGATSTTAWLANLTGITKGEAAKLVGLSRVTTKLTGAAWTFGQVTTDQAGVIMKAIDGLPDWVGDEERADAEKHLIDLAGDHNLDDLKRLANHVMEVIDPDGADEHPRQEAPRRRTTRLGRHPIHNPPLW